MFGNEGWANCLVRFLCTAALGGVLTALVVVVAIVLLHLLGDSAEGEGGKVHRVGTHVGDATSLVERLRHTHGLRNREAQFAGRFLLEGGSGEWWCWALGERTQIHIANGKRGIFTRLKECHGIVAAIKAARQFCRQRGIGAKRLHGTRHTEVWLTLEIGNLLLAVGNEAHSHTLHTASRQTRLNLAPKHWRKFKTHNAVEHTARLLGVHQIDVDIARVFDSLKNGWFGDFVKHDTARGFGLQAKHLIQVPSDSLSLAVLIGCEPHHLCLFRCFFQIGYTALLVFGDFVDRAETVFHINTEIALVQVANMALTCHHLVVFSKIFFDSLRLSRRLNNY